MGYYPPDVGFDYMKQVQLMKDLMGMEYMGYMEFFDSDAAAQIIEEHVSCSWRKDSISHSNVLDGFILECSGLILL